MGWFEIAFGVQKEPGLSEEMGGVMGAEGEEIGIVVKEKHIIYLMTESGREEEGGLP